MTSQPEPGQVRPDDFGGGDGRLGQAQPESGQPWQSESYQPESLQAEQHRPELPEQSQAEQYQAEPYRPEPYRPEPYRPEPYRPEPYRPEQYPSEHYRADQYQPEQCQGDQYQPEHYQGDQYQPEQYQGDQYQPEQYRPDPGRGGLDAPHPVPGLGGQRLLERQPGGQELGGRELRVREPRRRRSRGRTVAFSILLSAGLIGLAVAAVGIAHELLPRQFTPAQQRAIANWEMERRWLTLPAGKIFPATVSYAVPEQAPGTAQNLQLPARLLSVQADKSCGAAVARAVGRILIEHDCTTALQATYVDATGSMVATVAVAVLPDSAAASAVVSNLASTGGGLVWDETAAKQMVHPLRVVRTPAALFTDRQRQLSQALGAGPYVILSSAGFSDGRPWMRVRSDNYLEQEMIGFTTGLVRSTARFLGAKPPAPACPGAPGC